MTAIEDRIPGDVGNAIHALTLRAKPIIPDRFKGCHETLRGCEIRRNPRIVWKVAERRADGIRSTTIASIGGNSTTLRRSSSRRRGASQSLDFKVAVLLKVSSPAGLPRKLRFGLPDFGAQYLQLPKLLGEVFRRGCLASILYGHHADSREWSNKNRSRFRNEAVGRNMSARRLRRRGPGRGDNVRRSHASASGWLRNETRRLSLMRVFRVNSGTVSRSSADGSRPKLQGFGRRGDLRRNAASLVFLLTSRTPRRCQMPAGGPETGADRNRGEDDQCCHQQDYLGS